MTTSVINESDIVIIRYIGYKKKTTAVTILRSKNLLLAEIYEIDG